jgi:glycosyltransferase involved in cell wall biosynthesis
MKVSIITINLNNANGLVKTIQSVLDQSYNCIEYIVIDGGSSDKSVKVIENYKDKIQYWVTEKDNGIYNAMNKGLRIANGEYVLFLNSGDYFKERDIVQKCIEEIKHNLGSVFYGRVLLLPDNRASNEPASLAPEYFLHGNLHHQGIFYPLKVIQKLGGYDETLRLAADYSLNITLFKNECIFKSFKHNQQVACFNTDGLTYNQADLVLKEREIVQGKNKLFFELINLKIERNYYHNVIFANKINRILWIIQRGVLRIQNLLIFSKYNNSK